jgi:hypothetical protein
MTPQIEDTIERRKRTRQPMQRELRYRVLGHRARTGCGMTVNISSHSLAFQADGPLPVGAAIEVSVSWPAEAGSALRLTATGVVVRSDGRTTACTLDATVFGAEEVDEDGPAVPFGVDVGIEMRA